MLHFEIHANDSLVNRVPKATLQLLPPTLLLAFVLVVGAPGSAGEQPDEASPPPGDIATSPSELVRVPAFPGARAIRLRLESELLPGAGLEDRGAVTMLRSGLRGRTAIPVSSRLTLQALARYASTLYAFDGKQDFFGGARRRSSDPFAPLHDAALSLQSAFLLHESGHLIFRGERWSLLGELFGRARWETGAFENGLLGGGGLAFGYEFPGRLQLALGVAVRTQVAESGLGVDPVFSVRWRVTKQLTLRTRGRGGLIEYHWNRRLMTYATVFQNGQSWRLDQRRGVPSGTVLSDQQLRCGLGLEWRPHRRLRIHLEAGAIATRTIALDAKDSRSLSRIDGDPSGYMVLSLEIRP